MTDRFPPDHPTPDEPDRPDRDDLDPVSGEPHEATFDVESSGEQDAPGGGDVLSGPTGDDAEFTVDAQRGESLPPDPDDADEDWPWETEPPAPVPMAEEDDVAAAEDDLGLDAVPVTDGDDQVPDEDAPRDPSWEPPPATDALFGADDYPSPSDEPATEPTPGDPGFGAWDEGLDPLPADTEDVPFDTDDDLSAFLAADPFGDQADEPPPTDPAVDDEDPAVDRRLDDPPATDRSSGAVDDEPADWATFTDEHYVRVSQPDYQQLADLDAEGSPDAPSAVAAGIRGVDTGVVGLDDVVDEPATEPAASTGPSATDLGLRVLTGIGLLVLFAAALVYPLGLILVATALFALAAGEFYAVLVRSGQHPLSLFGLLGTAGGLIGAAVWGIGAIPVAVIATLVAVALYYALTSAHPDPLTDGGLTVMVVMWALLGAFVFPIIDSDDFRWWVAAVVVVVVAMDVGQYFVGRAMGSRPLAPVISPKKTVEGLIGGAAVTLVVATIISFFGPLTLPGTLALAGATIVLAPLGDLSVSLVKRIIGVKDMGTVLPGHGGILDRIDGLLFVIPAAWVILRSMGLLT